MDWPGALVKLDLPVGRVLSRAGRSDGLRRPGHGAALDSRVAGVLDGAQPGGDAGFAGGDGLAVAPAVGPFGPVGAAPFDLAGVGFALAGVRGEREHGDARGGGVQDEGDRLSLGVVAGQGGDAGPFGLGPGWLWCPAVVPGAGGGEQGVGAVDLVAGGAEVLPDRAEVGAAGDAVLHEPGGLGVVGVGGAGPGVDPQLGLQGVADGAGADEADQAVAKTGACGRAAMQIASRPAATWSTAVP